MRPSEEIYRILIISTGPGHRDHMTTYALRKAAECDVVVGMQMQLNALDFKPQQFHHREDRIEEILDLIERHRGRRVGVLVLGDAGIYSLSQKIIDRFGRESVEEIIPGVSSIQVAFARVKEQWLNVHVCSYRDKSLRGIEDVLRRDRVAILCDRKHTARVILSRLRRKGLFDARRKIYACQDLTTEDEHVLEIREAKDIRRLKEARREIVLVIADHEEE